MSVSESIQHILGYVLHEVEIREPEPEDYEFNEFAERWCGQ